MAQSKKTKQQINDLHTSTSRKKYLVLCVILFISFVIYMQGVNYALMFWDDNLYVTHNQDIRGLSFENFKLFFTEFYAGNYQPLTLISYAIEYYFVGLSPWLYHFTNIILHVINAVLVYILIKKIYPKSDYVALFVAAFFAIHPMKVESVVWISERKDVLYGFFFLLSLICYSNYLRSKKTGTFVLSALFFVCSCLSKSAAVILPIMMLAFDFYAGRVFNIKTIMEKAPLFMISIIFGYIAILSQKAAMPTEPLFSLDYRVMTVANAFISYFLKAILPFNLSALYPYPTEIPNTYYLSFILACGLIFSIIYFFRKSKEFVFGMLFFLISIMLVLQIKMVGNATMADRYTYIPYIGLFFILGVFIDRVITQYQTKKVILTMGLIIFSAITYSRTLKWKTDETLFTDIIEQYPTTTIAYNNRGVYYMNEAIKLMYDNKADTSAKSFDISSNRPLVQADRLSDIQIEYLQKSIADFDAVILYDSNYKDIYGNRALAKYYIKDYQGSYNDFIKYQDKEKGGVSNYFLLANIKSALGNHEVAIDDFTKAISLDSKNADNYYNRGNSKKELNDYAGALKDYDTAIMLNPAYLKAYNNRSILRCLQKDYVGTVEDYDKMIELNPMDTTTSKNRAIVMGLIKK